MDTQIAVKPKRIQRKRTRGWRMPEGAVCVSRPSRWGNPYRVHGPHPKAGLFGSERIETREECVEVFRTYALGRFSIEPDWLLPLQGKDLACWCRAHYACHADVLIELANTEPPRFGG